MPLITYACTDCDAEKEFLLQDPNQKLGIACDDCGGAMTKRFSTRGVTKGDYLPTHTSILGREMREKQIRLRGRMKERKEAGETMHRRANLLEA